MPTDDAALATSTSEVRYYERAAVRTFLERAAAARAQMEDALHAALVREEQAHAALAQTRYAGLELEGETADLREALRDERDAAWDFIATLLAEAEAEAAAVLAAATEEAEALRTAPASAVRQAAFVPVERHPPPSLDRLVGHPARTARLLAG
jgi:hypothetical protein